ncbi:MAG TPA: AMP-binding protein, partial [Polyangia bacterium]
MLLHELVTKAAARPPASIAIIDGQRRLTYAELVQAAQRFAGALQTAGVRRGERVLLFLPNSAEFVIALLGTSIAGAVVVPVHPQTKAPKLAYLLADTGAVALCAPAALGAIWRAALTAGDNHVATVFVTGPHESNGRERAWADVLAAAPWGGHPDTIDLDLAAIIYTSGTTGQPKGVMLTHQNMRAAEAAVSQYLALRPDDVIACVLPLCFSYGLYQPLLAARVGATLLLEGGFTFPTKVLEVMQREGATVFPAVPAIYAALLDLPNLDRFDLSRLRLFTNAAAALPLVHVAALRQRFPDARFLSMYGQTECKRISYLEAEEIDRRPGSVGRGIPNQELFLRDEAGVLHPLTGSARGLVRQGQLVVRGAHVMRGYWRKPEETAAKLIDGVYPGERLLLTGDLFRVDEDGFLYFVARTDDIIKSRGEKVSPREVENALHELVGVAHAAVVGVPDALLGEAVKAFVVRAPGAGMTEKDVIKFCLSRLENYMVPKHVAFVDALPLTASGKVDKSALKKDVS